MQYLSPEIPAAINERDRSYVRGALTCVAMILMSAIAVQVSDIPDVWMFCGIVAGFASITMLVLMFDVLFTFLPALGVELGELIAENMQTQRANRLLFIENSQLRASAAHQNSLCDSCPMPRLRQVMIEDVGDEPTQPSQRPC